MIQQRVRQHLCIRTGRRWNLTPSSEGRSAVLLEELSGINCHVVGLGVVRRTGELFGGRRMPCYRGHDERKEFGGGVETRKEDVPRGDVHNMLGERVQGMPGQDNPSRK